MSETFNKFQSVYRRILRFQKIGVLASWDLYTATPKLGFDDMSDTMTFASSEAFALSNSDEFFGLVEALNEPEEFAQLTTGMQYTIQKLKTELEKSRRIPQAFFEELVSLQNQSMKAWTRGKESVRLYSVCTVSGKADFHDHAEMCLHRSWKGYLRSTARSVRKGNGFRHH